MKFASILLCLLTLMASADQVAAQPTTLRLTMQVSTNNPLGRNVMDYKQAVETAAGGTLALDVRDKAQLFLDNQVPEAVGSGAVEMGIAQLGFYAGWEPSVELFQQPFLFDSDELTRAAADPSSEIRRYIDEQILQKTGARVLWWQPYGATVVMSKSAPIPNPEAMKGRNVRAFDAVAAEFVSLCGATPQVISGSKMLDALKAQKIDAVMTGVTGIPERELWRETQFITRIRHSAIIFVGIINEKIWQGLPVSLQKLMTIAARNEESGFWNRFAAAEVDAYRFAIEKGMQVREISESELTDWRVCSSELLERFVEKMGEPGVKLMAAYGKLKSLQHSTEKEIQPIAGR